MAIQVSFGGQDRREKQSFAVGIDLGTTNSLVAYVGPDGQPHVISGPDGAMVPSVIAFDAAGQVESVGHPANSALLVHPERTIYSVKRMMGRSAAEIVHELGMLPFQVHTAQGSAAVRIEVANLKLNKQ